MRRGIQIKTPVELEMMRTAGLVVADTLAAVRAAVAPGVSTAELDALAHDTITAAGAIPSFLDYNGFPKVLCTSVNEEVVHGIPRADKLLVAGDVISIDCGAILDDWHGDAAITVGVGDIDPELQRLLEVCERSMWAVFAGARLGHRMRDLGQLVADVVETAGFGIVDFYGGHGIGSEMHQDPHVLNHGRGPKGPKLVTGMALAIEPMITAGAPETRELADGWTVVTADGSYAAHFEHTFTLMPDGPWVLTAADGGSTGLARFGVAAHSGAGARTVK